MGVVALPRDVVDVQELTALDTEGVVDEAGDDAVLEDLARQLVAEVLTGPLAVVLVDVVDALEGVGDPADAALGEGEVQVLVLAQDRRPDQVGGRLHHVDGLQADHHVDRRLDRGHQDLRGRAQVHADDVPSSAHAVQKGSQCSLCSEGQPELLGVLREGDGVAALLGHPVHLLRTQLGVPDDGDRQRDEAPGLGAAPPVDVPVVVGLHHGAGLVLVLAPGEELAAELGEGGEAHGAEHAVDRHVAHTLVHVVAADPHVLERGGLDAVLLGRAADHGVEPDVGDLVAVVEPDVGAVVLADELGRLVLVLGGQQPVEHPPGLDDMVVDADQDHVLSAHSVLPFCTLCPGTTRPSLTPMSPTVRPRLTGGANRRCERRCERRCDASSRPGPGNPRPATLGPAALSARVWSRWAPGAPAGPGSPGSGRAEGWPGRPGRGARRRS